MEGVEKIQPEQGQRSMQEINEMLSAMGHEEVQRITLIEEATVSQESTVEISPVKGWQNDPRAAQRRQELMALVQNRRRTAESPAPAAAVPSTSVSPTPSATA